METKRLRSSGTPEWVQEYKRRTKLIDIIAEVFEYDCDCKTCEALREIAGELGNIFFPAESPRGPRR